MNPSTSFSPMRRLRTRTRAARAMLLITAINIAIFAMLAGPVIATSIRTSGGMTVSFANTLYCRLTGCTMTGATSYSGTNPDITTPGAEDLNLLPGSGLVEIKKSGNSILKFVDGSGNTANLTWAPNGFSLNNVTGAGSVYMNTGAFLARTGNQSATSAVGGVHDSVTTISAGTGLLDVYGEGLMTAGSGGVQTATCATGTVSIDPQSSVVIVDGNAATCTATIATTSMGTINQEGLPIRISAKNVGASTIKLASTNFATALPARCTTTGLALGQSALIAYDKDQAKWTFLGGCE